MRDRLLSITLAPTLDGLVVALCGDYERREEVIRAKTASLRTETEYRYLNAMIYTAACEVVKDFLANGYITDIGRRTGYAKTENDFSSEKTYKLNKKAIKVNIAKKLHLID